MSVNDLAELLIAARGRVDFYWNFYAVMVIAIIGWLVSAKKHFTVPMKALVTAAYVLASAMNLMGLYSSYSLAEALRADLVRAAAGTPLVETRVLLDRHSYELHRAAALAIHLGLAAAILVAVWTARFSAGEGERGSEAAAPPRKAGRR